MDFLSIGLGAGAAALQNRWNKQAEKRQYERNVKMMGIQTDNQMRLNRQGADLSYENWQRTSYPAQLAMMKAAGLSPGLMYGQGGGQGGTTVGSAGSASGGSVSQGKFDIANALQAAQLAANIDLTKAQTKKTEVEAENVAGVDRELKTQQAASLSEGIENMRAQRRLTNVESELKEVDLDIQKSTKVWQIEKVREELLETASNAVSALNNANLSTEQYQDKIDLLKREVINAGLDSALKRLELTKGETEVAAIKERLLQDWERIAVAKKGNEISQFEANIRANYPSVFNAIGNLLLQLEAILDRQSGSPVQRHILK